MRVLVTGGAGFIGSHVVDALLDEGAEVAIVDHLRRSPRPWLTEALRRGASLHVADVRDLDALRIAFKAAQPETVMHLAAQVDVRRSVADPAFDVGQRRGDRRRPGGCARWASRRVILASTAATYGDPERLPTPRTRRSPRCRRTAPRRPRRSGISPSTPRARPVDARAAHGDVYGPRQDAHGEAGVIAIFAGAAVEGRDVEVYGDGHQTRDYVSWGDVVRAWIAASDADVTGALTSRPDADEHPRTGRELRRRHEHVPGRAGEITHSCLDPSAAGARSGGGRVSG